MSDKRLASFERRNRPGDLPAAELVKQANKMIAAGWTVNFKFTCAWCGERCTLQDDNTLWPEGECFQCGKTTIIDVGGFVLTKTGTPDAFTKKGD